MDHFIYPVSPHDAIDLDVELAGYPLVPEKIGWCFQYKGQIKSVSQSSLGGWCIWFDTNASQANMGATIFATSKRFVNKAKAESGLRNKRDLGKIAIGVYAEAAGFNGLNLGTLLTEEI